MPYKESEGAREHRLQHNREYHAKNKDRLNAQGHERYAKNKEQLRTKAREHYATHKELMKARVREYHAKNRDRRNAKTREYRAKVRARSFEIYGKECICGEKDARFLTLGHKNNDGGQDRRENGNSEGVLRCAIKHPDHTRYETQCYNCQHIGWLNHLANKTYADNSEKANKHRACVREGDHKRRQRGFQVLGGAVCACCGETDARVLAFAHKHNNGGQERRELGQCGTFKRIFEHPEDYEILCANCNEGAAHNGDVCPHKTRGSSTLSTA